MHCHTQCIMTIVVNTSNMTCPIHITHFKPTLLIMVGTQSKECTVFRWSNNGIVGSKPTRCRDVSACFLCLLYVGSGLAMGQTTAKQFYQMSQFLHLYRVSIQPLFSNIASLLLLLGIIHPLVEFMHYLNGSRASGNKLLLSCHLL